jgi:heterodisulfide reductase subunit B
MKEIPLDNYYHFKSCVGCTFHPGMDSSLLYIYDRLGVKYVNDPGQSTCMGFCYHNGIVPFGTNLAINARNLSLVEESGKSCVCVCPTSYGNLRECGEHLSKHPESLARVNAVLKNIKRSYGGSAKVYHASEVIYAHRERLLKMAKHGLGGLRVATHHGCHYTKIFYNDTLGGGCENPTLLDEIVETFGGKAVDYPERSLCCGMGFYHTLENREYTRAISLRKLRSIRKAQPDIIVTHCPGCLFVFDYFQRLHAEATGEKFSIPVINIAQLVSVLLGGDPRKVAGAEAHMVSLSPVLKRLETGPGEGGRKNARQ